MNFKLFYCFFLVFFTCTLGAQSKKHQDVWGIKASIVPPEGFVQSKKYGGFTNEKENSSITFNEFPTSYSTFDSSFVKQLKKDPNLTFIKNEKFKTKKHEGTLFTIIQKINEVDFYKHFLMLGNDSITLTVTASYPLKDKDKKEKVMKKSLKSLYFDPTRKVNAGDFIDFTIDASKTGFKLAKAIPNNVIYNEDGLMPSKTSSIVLGRSLNKSIITDKIEFAKKRLNQLPSVTEIAIEKEEVLKIDGYEAVELFAKCKDKFEKEQLLYQTIIYFQDEYYIAIGLTSNNDANDLEKFVSITRSFKRIKK